MLGVIAGDIIGSKYEFTNDKRYHFKPLFHPKSKYTDDTICTTAVMRSLSNDTCPVETMHAHCANISVQVVGGNGLFNGWQLKIPHLMVVGETALMRMGPVGWVANSVEGCHRTYR